MLHWLTSRNHEAILVLERNFFHVLIEKNYGLHRVLERREVFTLDKKPLDKKPKGYVFRTWFRCAKTGEKIWAKHYGKKAWKIPVY